MKAIIASGICLMALQWMCAQKVTYQPLDTNAVYKIVEEMPQFPGCENLPSAREKRDCTSKKMLEFIFKNTKISNSDCLSRCYTVNVCFTVEKDGNLSDFLIKKSSETKTDNAVLNAVKALPNFIPGKQRGHLVRVQMTLPIHILLE